MFYKKNKSLFIWSHKNDHNFLQKFVIFHMITDSFLVEKWGGNGQGGTSTKNY